MKRLIPILFLVLPIALFAQRPREQESAMLKGLGLNDSQIAQVLDIQSKTRATVRQDRVQLQLLHAQMDKALLPPNPNMQEVNGYIAQMARAHADLMKAYVGGQVQLRQIIGEDNFPFYTRFMRRGYELQSPRDMYDMHRQMPGGMTGGSGSMMGGNQPMMGGTGSMMGNPVDEDE